MTLGRLALTAENLVISDTAAPGNTRVSALTVAAEYLPDQENTYRLGIRADDFQPSLPWKALVDPADKLPTTLSALNADVTVQFDKPWDRTAIETARPQPVYIQLRLAEARWGQLELQAAGTLKIDADGQPMGEVTLKAKNWREILDLAKVAGLLPDQISGPVTDGLALISQLAGHPQTLDIPLEFAKGSIWLGPVPLAKAPVLTLR